MVMRELKKDYPGLHGYRIHVFDGNSVDLSRKLVENHFQIITIDGKEIRDEASFFKIFSMSLKFPQYFGHNWDAWDECLYDFGEELDAERIALIWNDSDFTLRADLQTFLTAVCDLRELSVRVTNQKNDKSPKVQQFEIFLAGQWS